MEKIVYLKNIDQVPGRSLATITGNEIYLAVKVKDYLKAVASTLIGSLTPVSAAGARHIKA